MASQLGYEALSVSTTALGPTAATVTPLVRSALFYVKGAAVRWRADSTAPTASVGTPIEDGGYVMVTGEGVCREILFIRRDSVDATVHAMYFSEPLDIRMFSPLAVEGIAASDAPEQGNPVQIAGSVDTTTPVAATEGDARRISTTAKGRLFSTTIETNDAGEADGVSNNFALRVFDEIDALHPFNVNVKMFGFAPDGALDRLRTVGDSGEGLGRLAVGVWSKAASDVKEIAVDVAATSATRQTLLTPTSGKKVRIINVTVVTRGLTTNPDRVGVYFGTGAAYMTTVANAIGEYVPGTTGRQESNYPDGGGPVGAVDAVVSGITETETELTMRYTIAYREE